MEAELHTNIMSISEASKLCLYENVYYHLLDILTEAGKINFDVQKVTGISLCSSKQAPTIILASIIVSRSPTRPFNLNSS